MDNRPAALAGYTKAIELDPVLAFAYNGGGETYRRCDEAIADFKAALAINPEIQESVDALKELGVRQE